MNRRKAIKQLGLLTGGMVLLPSCNLSGEKVARAMNGLSVTASQEELMQEIVASIIPEGKLPGALSLNVHDFVWVMADDCLADEEQRKFLKGLDGFKEQVRALKKDPFNDLEETERADILRILEDPGEEMVWEEVTFFVKKVKEFSILGYMQSEYVMTEVMPYPLVPGKNPACNPVDPQQRINVNG